MATKTQIHDEKKQSLHYGSLMWSFNFLKEMTNIKSGVFPHENKLNPAGEQHSTWANKH